MSAEQQGEYDGHEGIVARLASIANRRPLTQPEQDKLLRHLNMMRMVCDTNYILNPRNRQNAPNCAELEKILEECRENPDVKVIVFSEWERMLELVRETCLRLELGFAWHTGSVPQETRRAEIILFKTDPKCRVFLSTDSGASGLNLQNASVVINCDLPWNPAKLEQRIARAWRKHQTRPVTVINLISENTIEHRMLDTLSHKRALSEGVLDLKGDLNEIKLRSGKQAFLAKLEQLITTRGGQAQGRKPPPCRRIVRWVSRKRRSNASTAPFTVAKNAIRWKGRIRFCSWWWRGTRRNSGPSLTPCIKITLAPANPIRLRQCAWKSSTARPTRPCNG